MSQEFDVAVIGAGAAGMMCAAVAGQRGKKVVLIDHATRLAEKIRISGGGRCNFTNRDAGPQNYLSENPHFCRSALSRYTARDFIDLVKRHRIAFHEKHKGQLFCDDSAEDIIAMLKAECEQGKVAWRMPCKVAAIGKSGEAFRIDTDAGEILAQSVVIASGGLSIPKIGATDFAYRIARQFDLKLVEPRPALVPLTFAAQAWQPFVPLAGIALEVEIETGEKKARGHFLEDLLFTHRGLSGPAVLQISSFWHAGTPLLINLAPQEDMTEALLQAKSASKKNLANTLAQWLPARLAESWLQVQGMQWRRPPGRPAGQATAPARRIAQPLAHRARRHGRLQEGGSHARRRRYARTVAADHDGQQGSGTVLHRRIGRCHRLAGRLQFPVGMVIRRGGRAGGVIATLPIAI